MILHREDCNGSIAHRKKYITSLNHAYKEHFENMDEYKHENNFKRCLKKLELPNVIEAIKRAEKIMIRNQDNGYVPQQYKGYQYYKENPSLEIHRIIGKILKECELMP